MKAGTILHASHRKSKISPLNEQLNNLTNFSELPTPLLHQETEPVSVYLISQSTVLHKKLIIIGLTKILSMFFVQCSSQTPDTSSHSISLKFTLVLSFHVCLVPEVEFFLQVSYVDILYAFLISSKGVNVVSDSKLKSLPNLFLPYFLSYTITNYLK